MSAYGERLQERLERQQEDAAYAELRARAVVVSPWREAAEALVRAHEECVKAERSWGDAMVLATVGVEVVRKDAA